MSALVTMSALAAVSWGWRVGGLLAHGTLIEGLAVLFGNILARLTGNISALLPWHILALLLGHLEEISNEGLNRNY